MDYTLFIISFASVSFLPGLCMSLALNLGLTFGFRKSLFMFVGELGGVLLVILVCGYGASFILNYDFAFKILQFFGALFLFYTAFVLYKQDLHLKQESLSQKDKFALVLGGFLASVSNPKAWIFMLSLLPSFLGKAKLWELAAIILFIEFLALCTYNLGGKAFGIFLQKYLHILSKISSLCIGFLALLILYELFKGIK